MTTTIRAANDSFNSSAHGGERLHYDSDDDGQVPGTSTARARVVNNRKRERKHSDSSNEQDPLLKPSIPPHEMLKYCQVSLNELILTWFESSVELCFIDAFYWFIERFLFTVVADNAERQRSGQFCAVQVLPRLRQTRIRAQ